MVESVRQHLRPRVLVDFTSDSCVATTRIAIDVFDYFGVPASPLPVTVIILNTEATNIIESGGTVEDVAKQVWQQNAQTPGGPWTIGLGFGEEKDGAGHVALMLPSISSVADFSIDQATRRHKNIALEPVVFPVADDANPSDWEGATVQVQSPGEAAVTLMYASAEPRYRHSPNWRRVSGAPGGREAFRSITGDVIRTVREDLGI